MAGKMAVAVVVMILANLSVVGQRTIAPPKEAVFEAECVAVADGDTITVLRGNRQVRIRLEGIDCPELHQSFGTRAKLYTSSLLFGREVTVDPKYLDRNGRTVARVSVGGKDASLMLVQVGLAWHFKRYSSDPLLGRAEEQARRLKKGLWSERQPLPPWQWRRAHPR